MNCPKLNYEVSMLFIFHLVVYTIPLAALPCSMSWEADPPNCITQAPFALWLLVQFSRQGITSPT